MIVKKEHIALYIPQRAPFIMIDNLLQATPTQFHSDFRVAADNIFLEGRFLREFALIENIAQTSAAGIGYLNRESSTAPRDGFIGGISKLVLHELPTIDDLIQTHVHLRQQLGHMYLLRGENVVKGKTIMECEVKLVGFISDR